MEHFFIPTNKLKFVKWLLKTALNSNYTIVLEYSNNDIIPYLKIFTEEHSLPISASHNYKSNCRLIAIKVKAVTDDLVNLLMKKTHVLSLHSETKMVFLIADDYHEQCFSCSLSFYNQYLQQLQQGLLISNVL